MGLYVDFRDFLKENAHETLWIHRKRLSVDLYGQCYEVANGWQIDIRKDMSEDAQVDTLIHEYAHVLGRTHWHGEAFGKAYAKVYKMWLDYVRYKNESDGSRNAVK